MSLEGVKINNKSILISELGNNIFSNNFDYNTSFQIDYTLPLTIKLKNVSYDEGSSFFIQFREGDVPVAYLNNEGRVTSSLLWLTDIPVGTTKEIKDIDLTLCYEVFRNGKKIDNFVVSGANPAPTFG